jgi:hypothetical protein
MKLFNHMKHTTKKQPTTQQYMTTPARSLIGQRMLIIDIHEPPDSNGDCLHVHAELEDGRRVCFRAGVVVRHQLENQRFFPVWVRLNLVQGKQHEYYRLDIANTVQVCGNRWHFDFNSETRSWITSGDMNGHGGRPRKYELLTIR